MDLTDLVHELCKQMPKEERYSLTDQLNRCSISIPSNIAEGSGKRTNKHFAEFLSTSFTSSFELETQLLICERRNYCDKDLRDKSLKEVVEIQKMIFSFREGLN